VIGQRKRSTLLVITGSEFNFNYSHLIGFQVFVIYVFKFSVFLLTDVAKELFFSLQVR